MLLWIQSLSDVNRMAGQLLSLQDLAKMSIVTVDA